MKLEETDKKILNIIVENSRLSLRQIALKADVSVATETSAFWAICLKESLEFSTIMFSIFLSVSSNFIL